jgi:hypothetical protein
MPIRPEHVFLYPIDWVQLSHRIRFVRAGERCEHCGVPICRRSSTSATDGGGIGAGNAGATAEAGAYDDL